MSLFRLDPKRKARVATAVHVSLAAIPFTGKENSNSIKKIPAHSPARPPAPNHRVCVCVCVCLSVFANNVTNK